MINVIFLNFFQSTLDIKCIKQYYYLKNNYLVEIIFRSYTKDTKGTTRETGKRGGGEKRKAKTGGKIGRAHV